jgi:hypothetical protein
MPQLLKMKTHPAEDFMELLELCYQQVRADLVALQKTLTSTNCSTKSISGFATATLSKPRPSGNRCHAQADNPRKALCRGP